MPLDCIYKLIDYLTEQKIEINEIMGDVESVDNFLNIWTKKKADISHFKRKLNII